MNKTLIEKYNITDTIEQILEKEYIIFTPKAAARAVWKKSFKKMHENGEDKLLMSDVFEDEIFEEGT